MAFFSGNHSGRRRVGSARWTSLGAASVGLAAALFSHNAEAQRVGWAVDRVEPSPAGDLFFQTHFPVYAVDRAATLFFGLANAYSSQPLLATIGTGTSAETVAAIEHLFATHAQVNVHLAGRLGLDLSLPIYWVQTGSQDPSIAVRAASGVSAGDLRLGVRLRIVGRAERDPASLHLAATGHFGFLPTAGSAQTTSDGAFRARLFAVGAGSAGVFRWSLSAGAQLRPGIDVAAVHVGSEMFALAGVGVSLASSRIFLGAEGEFATDLASPFQSGTNHVQLWGVVRAALLDDSVRIAVGAGPGLTQAPGTPALGAFLTVAYAIPLGATSHATPALARPTGEAPHAATPTAVQHEATQSSTTVTNVASSAPSSAVPSGEPASVVASASPVPASEAFCSVPSDEHCVPSDDADGDGIREPLDQCPSVVPGPHPDPTRPGCPDVDTDGDLVFDHFDQCPTAAQGTAPDPERRGCPLPDADGDRIPDAIDHCPNVPGAPHPDPTLNGCPGLVRLEADSVRILQPIFFAPNRDVIQARSNPVMQAVANALTARTDIRYMLIEGHTDDLGNAELNVDLSQRRAAAVLRWLIDHGISPVRLQSRGMGSMAPSVPIVPGMRRRALRDARSRNRRVDFEILNDPHAAVSSSAPPAGGTR